MNRAQGEAFELGVELLGDTDVVLTRRFHAPKRLVWRCYTEPDLVKRWLIGNHDWEMSRCDIDLRPGGRYHQRWRHRENGAEFGFVGLFHDIVAPDLIRADEWPDDMQDAPPAQNTIAFLALGDMTELKMTMRFADQTTRDAVLATGMADGVGLSFDLMDRVLDTMTD